MPAIIAALLLPRPRASGIWLSTSNRAPGIFLPRSSATERATRGIRFDSSRGTRSAPSPEGTTSNPLARSSIVTRRYSESANPHASKLAPRFEVDAGIVISVAIVSATTLALKLEGPGQHVYHLVVYQPI